MKRALKGWLVGSLVLGSIAWAGPAAAQIVWPQPILTQVVSGVSDPVHIAHAGDGSGRLFIVERAGRIRIYQNGSLLSTPFLDITSRTSVGGERGLLSVAFPPGYETNGRFYVFYTQAVGGDLVIARYHVTANPNVANASSEEILLIIEHSSATNHNGGQLAFSPTDGYLYISTGDGGNTPAEAQNLSGLLGKLLRIDVESGAVPYAIPPDNPFLLTGGARQELWARGLRNPWRFAFDQANGDLYLADVGQNSWEEVDVQRDTSLGGENYGWNIMEGLHCYQVATCNQAGLTLPVLEYSSTGSDCAIMGGVVYRGSAYPRMQGVYFYADYCTGKIWGLQHDGTTWQSSLLTTFGSFAALTSFGEGEDGSIYFTDSAGGAIYRITDNVATTADMRVTMAASPSTATVGQPVTLTATVTNLGGATATGVTLNETLATGPTIGTITASQGNCSRVNQAVTCALGTLANGASATVAVVLTPAAAGTLTNTATVSATQSDPNTANNNASLATPVISPSADLAVSLTDSPDPVAVNETLTYTVTVTNNGPSAATGVTMTDTLPAGVTFVSATPSQGSCSGTNTVTCSLGSLGIGVTATTTIRVTAPGAVGTLTATASVSAGQPDPNSGNNNTTASTSVVLPSPLTNISTRAFVGTGSDAAVGGFIISGTGTKQVLIRGFGPTLADFGVAGALANPTLELSWDDDNNPNTPAIVVLTNDDWGLPLAQCSAPVVACGTPQAIADTGMSADSYAPSNPNRGLDAAVLLTVPPGTYTATLRGVSNGTGVGLIGVDDVDSNQSATLINISTRAFVGTGANAAVGGLIVGGTAPKQVLLRGFGPTLTSFGVAGAMANPVLELYWDDDNNPNTAAMLIVTNDNWGITLASCSAPVVSCGTPQDIINTGMSANTYAPSNPNRGLDAALLVTLPPGTYTATLRGVSNGTGVGLIGVDEIVP